MDRRNFSKAVGAGVASLVLPGCAGASRSSAGRSTAEKPNIIFIVSDDHAANAISCYGSHLAQVAPTPNIDRIAKEGMLFKNCFVTNSICTPSRAAIFSGKYSHVNVVYKFTALDQRQPTLPKLLREAVERAEKIL